MNPMHAFCGRNQPNGIRIVFYFFLLCTLLSCGACEKAPVKPSNITSNDVCFHCKSPITDVTFAAELVANNGFPRKFDDISCLIADAKKLGKKTYWPFTQRMHNPGPYFLFKKFSWCTLISCALPKMEGSLPSKILQKRRNLPPDFTRKRSNWMTSCTNECGK